MRLFFAVELPPEVQTVLRHLRADPEGRDYRWVDPSLLHVTLAFLGEQPPDALPALEDIGRSAAREGGHEGGGAPAELRLGTAGHFGSSRAPRVLWVDLAGDIASLATLHTSLTRNLRERGFPTEDRPFRAHITLARRRETARGGPPPGWPPDVQPTRFKLHSLTLMQSKLSPRGATYTPVSHFAIGG